MLQYDLITCVQVPNLSSRSIILPSIYSISILLLLKLLLGGYNFLKSAKFYDIK